MQRILELLVSGIFVLVTPEMVRAQSSKPDNLLAAQTIAEKYLKQVNQELDLIIDSHYTIEKAWGWVFFYNTRKAIETGNWKKYGVVGNGPLVVDRCGKVIPLTASGPPEQVIRTYESTVSVESCGEQRDRVDHRR